jgi:hypothetical protein
VSKYTTEELIQDMQKPTWEYASGELDEIIVAKLRAADALCAAAKEVRMAVVVYALPHDSAEFDRRIDEYEEAGS